MQFDGNDLIQLGIPEGPLIGVALDSLNKTRIYPDGKPTKQDLLDEIQEAFKNPEDNEWNHLNEFATKVLERREHKRHKAAAEKRRREAIKHPETRDEPLAYKTYGGHLIAENAKQQMTEAMRLPIATRGSLMPDAHLGYGLPIGGVLETKNAIIPWAVGVDIACRMMVSIFPGTVDEWNSEELVDALIEETRFGPGARFEYGKFRDDEVLEDEKWYTHRSFMQMAGVDKALAHRQLGTSGGGNHFVEFCDITFEEDYLDIPAGQYMALMSHSGSRGLGFKLANYFSKLASMEMKLPGDLQKMAWFEDDGELGIAYWDLMNLAGDYASACHHAIHRTIGERIGGGVMHQVENHHNFAWKTETPSGNRYYIHRKGATPAAEGEEGIIPGSMADHGYLVVGKGDPRSLSSASHGAGRTMSRRQAHKEINKKNVFDQLAKKKVRLLGAGLDEAPNAYKDIDDVVAEQKDLVTPIAKIQPRIVRMAPDKSLV